MAYDGSIKFDTSLDDNGLKKGLSGLSGLAGAAGKGITAAFAAAGAGIGAAVKVGMNFESSMSQVAATMGITSAEIAAGSEEYKILEAAAKKAGATTMFSASQSADALNYLALAGYDAATAADVLPSVLDLAAAGGMDLAYASDLATDAMAALGIEASSENLTHFGDEMAKTAQKSNTSVAQLGEAILVCAGTAKNAGQSLETVNTALGVMANRGIKGSEGGTHLRNVLLSLTAPTDKSAKSLKKLGVEVADSEGNIRDLGDILGDLKKSMSGMSEEARTAALSEIFNKTDISAINALLDAQGDEWDTLKEQISNADGAMADMAETMNDNLKGKLTILSSSLEGLGIAVYDGIKDPLKDAVDSAIDGISTLSASISDGELQPAIENVGSLIGSLASTLGTVLTGAVEGAINVLSFLGEHAEIAAGAIAGLGAAFGVFKLAGAAATAVKSLAAALALITAHPILAAVAAVAGLAAGIAVIVKKNRDAYKSTEEYKRSIQGLSEAIDDNNKAVDTLKGKQHETLSSYDTEAKTIQRYKDELDTLIDAEGRVAKADQTRANFLIGELNNALGTEIKMTDGVVSKYQDLQSEIDNLILKKKAVALLEANEGIYKDALEGQTEAFNTYNDAQQKVLDTKVEIASAQRELNELESVLNSSEATAADVENYEKLKSTINQLEGELSKYEATAKDAYSAVGEYSAVIADQTALDAAIQSGNMDEITNAYENMRKHALLSNAEVEGDTAATLNNLKNDVVGKLGATAGAWEEYKDNSTAAAKDAAQTAQSELKTALQAYQDAGGNLSALAPYFEAAGISLVDALSGSFFEGADKVTAAAESSVEAAGENAKATAQAKGAEGGDAYTESFAEHADSSAAAEAAAEGVEAAGESAKSTAQAKGQEAGTALPEAEASGIESGGGDVSAAASEVISTAASAAGSTATTEGQGIGKNLAAGIAAGISSGKSDVISAASALTAAAIQAAKDAGVIKSPSRKMRDEVGVMLVEGLKVGITEHIDEVPEAFKGLIDDIKLQLELGAITEAEYYKKLEEYRNEYLSKGSDEWWNYTKEIIKYEDRLTEEQRDREFKRLENLKELRIVSERDYYRQLEALRDKYIEKGSDDWEEYTLQIARYYQSVLDDMAAEYSEKLDGVHDKMDSLRDKLDSGFELSHSVTLTLEKQGVEYDQEFDFLNTDIDAYTQELRQWTDVMERLKDRGANSSYMERLFELEPNKAYSLAQQLLKQSDDEFSAYMKSYDEYEKELDRRSKLFYRGEELEIAQAAKNFGDSFVTEFADSLGDLDSVMAEAGYESARAFADEFISEIQKDLQTVTAVIAGTGEGIYLGGGMPAGGNYQYNTYQFNSSGETVSQQLRAARDAAKVEQLRGGYK